MRNRARPGRRSQFDRNRQKNSHAAEMKQDKLHSAIADYEEFKQTILPAIQKDLKAGFNAKQIREKYAAILQAKMITNAMTTFDVKDSTAISKDVIDRVEGKATEKKEVSHRFADMSDKELDAVLKSEEEDLENMEERFDQ